MTLTLCEVEVWSSDCALCPAHPTSPVRSVAVEACRCDPGYSGPDGGACVVCAANTFKAGPGAGSCVGCAADSTSAEGSGLAADCTCNAGYSGPDGGPCVACAAGTFKAASGGSAYVSYVCPANQFSSEVAANTVAVCWACPSSALSLPASTSSAACQCRAGTYEETRVLNPPHAQRKYSSIWDNAMFGSVLDGLSNWHAWSPATAGVIGDWMEIDVGNPIHLVGVITQGRGNAVQTWATLIQVQY